jgi:GTPase
VEYKRQLHQCTPMRLEKLKTQMSYRMDQGNGCCVYRIGVEDDGCHSLLGYKCVAETAAVLEYLARSLNAVVLERKMIQNEVMSDGGGSAVKCCSGVEPLSVVEPSLLGNGRDQLFSMVESSREGSHDITGTDEGEEKSTKDDIQQQEQLQQLDKKSAYTRAEITIQRIETHLLDPSPIVELTGANPTQLTASSAAIGGYEGESMSINETLSTRNIRVAVVGNVDAGKSTMIGTLTSSCLDDGRGSSRTSIMKHRHEIESGRTSTATTHLMGFRSTGEAIASRDQVRANRRKTEDEVARQSYRVVTLMDLAGHEKYLKTT